MALLLAACAQSPAKTAKTGGGPVTGKELEPAAATEWVRVERVALAVFRGGRRLCGQQVAPTLGLAYANRESFNPALQPAADELLGFDEHLKVTRVVEGSPAAKAGLQIGDVLMSVGGRLAPSGPRRRRSLRRPGARCPRRASVPLAVGAPASPAALGDAGGVCDS
jgi:membrane-associated protease RseP (regulator of RpoE activity)